jgi:2-polyprenyl-6-methoxyphenol hydroxylase-like FAD-dependent oxidoreductase
VLADGTVTHTVARGALHRALQVEAQRRGVRIAHDRRLVDVRPDGAGVIAEFSDGSAVRGDVLIGADGLHSRVRRLIDPTAPVPRYSGLGNVGGFAPPGCADIAPGVYRMVFGRRAFFGYTVSPTGQIWWFANPLQPVEPSRAALAAITAAQWKDELCALFADDAGPAAAIVRATEGPITGTGTYDLPRVPVWSRGPILILGDAAHAASPSSGQGASMAIEDGVEVARCLRDLPIPDALAGFEALRRARVERVVAEGARRGASKTVGPVGRVLRDLLLPVFLRRAARDTAGYAWLYDHHIDWDAPVGDRRSASRAVPALDENRPAPAA